MLVNEDRYSGSRAIGFSEAFWTAAFLALLIAIPWTIHSAVQFHAEHVILLLDPVHHQARPFLKSFVVETVAQPPADKAAPAGTQ